MFMEQLLFCRLVVLAVFTLSSVAKVKDFAAFRSTVAAFSPLPSQWNTTVSAAIVAGELTIVIVLAVAGSLLPLAFLLAGGLLTIFSIMLIAALRRRTAVSCNCFGPSDRRISPFDVVRNLIVVACSLIGLYASSTQQYAVSAPHTIVIALMAVNFVMLIINLTDIIETLRQPLRTS